MEKTPRYTQRERNMVLGFAAQYKDVIENKRTDAESNRKKDEVWRQIAKEFNARVYHQRSSKQLRQLYKNMKLLLKKDLCGEGKSNRSFMDLLNTLSQQDSVAQYMAEQMSPGGEFTNNGRQHKYDEDYDDSKMPSVGFDNMDSDVIVIKSEDISDNEQSHNGCNPDDMDDDDDDCLSPKDIPEVCLEEEDDEIFAADLRRTLGQQNHPRSSLHLNPQFQSQNQPNGPSDNQHQNQQPEVSVQSVGSIRVGSIGSIANLKALQNGSNSALNMNNGSNNNNNNNSTNNNNICNNNNNNNSINNNNNSSNPLRQTSAEQAQQQLLLSGLGLSAVHPTDPPPLPALQRGGPHNNANSNSLSNATNQLLLTLSGGNHKSQLTNSNFNANNSHQSHTSNYGHSQSNGHGHGHGHGHGNSTSIRNNDYLMSLAIEERKRKIDLLNAQIDYWKTLTKKLDDTSNNPTCHCHFPGKVNGVPPQTNSS